MKIYVDSELPECCNDCEFGYLTIYVDEDITAEINLLNFIDNQIKELKGKMTKMEWVLN